ncbi:MAG: PAS domain S-box protein [Methanomicrobiaceae archaeon]|nr:PAS domain S-box protein [Methanomicrobiaceae archaeon]
MAGPGEKTGNTAVEGNRTFTPGDTYQEIFESTENIAFILDKNATILFANSTFSQMMECSLDEIEGVSTITQFIHPGDRNLVMRNNVLTQKDPGAIPRAHEVRFIDKKGNTHNVLVTAALIPGTKRTIVSGRDITLHREIGDALIRSEAQYRRFVENHPDPLLIHADWVIAYLNPAAATLFGTTGPEELIGRPILDCIAPECREIVRGQIREGYRGVKGSASEQRLICCDGKIIDVEMTNVPSEFDGVPAIQVIIREITFRKKTEAQIRTWNNQMRVINKIIQLANSSLNLDEMLEIILDNTIELLDFDAGSVYLKNRNGNTADLVVTNGLPEMFCREEKSVNIRDWPYNLVFFAGQPRYIENRPGLSPGLIESRMLEDIDAYALAGIPLITESVVVGALYIARRSGDHFTEDEKATLESIGKEIGGTILRGMLQDSLERAYEETSSYLNIIEKSIRKSNDALLAYVRAARDIGCPTESLTEMIAQSLRQSSELINNIATIRRINELPEDIGVISLDDRIEGAVAAFPDVRITWEKNGLFVYADEFLFELLSNLITNSIQFGGPDVDICIRTEMQDEMVWVSVEDTGPGIPDADKRRIFTCFDPLARSSSKRGLGLHISQMLVLRYGGNIWAEDRVSGDPSHGVVIRFTLPVATEESE